MSRSNCAVTLAERVKRVKRVIRYSYPFPPFPSLLCDPIFSDERAKRGGIADHALHALCAPTPLEIKSDHTLISESTNEHRQLS